jgi:transposase
MSTSLLYHAFGIRGYEYVRTDYHDGATLFTIRQDPQTCRGSACGSRQVISRGHAERQFLALPIGRRKTTVALPIPRVESQACGRVRQVEVPFADPRRSYTRSFERYVLELSRRMTIKDVAHHLDIGWDMVKDIQKRDLKRRYAKPKFKHLRAIAIDEISVARGHRYLTVVMDLESGAVVFVGDGKGADALKPFWKRVRPSGAKIQAVALDMSGAYQAAVRMDLRRALYREATDVQHKAVLKGTRWLLLKNAANLDPEKDEKSRLQEALKLNEPLAVAYSMKEDLRRFWDQPGKHFATTFLDGWIRRAEASGIRILQQMAKTLAAHRSGLLAYYDVMISSGPMEGTNNKIKTMKRQAYGFRDLEFFKLKILAIHETKYALVG